MHNTHELRRAQARLRKLSRGPGGSTQRALLEIRRRGGLTVSYRNGRPVVSAADGMPVSHLPLFSFEEAIERGWLLPDARSPGLLPDAPAQRYVVDESVAGEGR